MTSPPEAPHFSDLGLSDPLLKQVAGLGFEHPTPIQAECIPLLLEGRDLIGRARTGSGKTAAFGLPLLEGVDPQLRAVQALVLCPTRELALQVTAALKSYSEGTGIYVLTLYGGASYSPQERALRRGVQVVVGTPGRTLDHLNRGNLRLDKLQYVALDEADEMLRMGFIEDVDAILGAAPEERQVALFSATLPRPIRRVAESHLREPLEVQVEEDALSVGHITQQYMVVPDAHKLDALERLLRVRPQDATLVFNQTRAGCAQAADALTRRGLRVDALHGDLSQEARERVLQRLRARRLDVVVATDVAARGLDIDHLKLIVNMSLPRETESYVHRIGRTGRAGREGLAITLVSPRQRRWMTRLARDLKVTISEIPPPSDRAIALARQSSLLRELQAAEVDADAEVRGPGADLVARLLEETDWSPESLLERAALVLAKRAGVDLELPEEGLPGWVRPPRKERPRRDEGAPRSRGPKGRKETHKEGINEATLFFPMGWREQLRPADLVGALANELGIKGSSIGKIQIGERSAFVGMPRHLAESLIAEGSSLTLRGRELSLRMARPQRGPPPHRGKQGGYRGGKSDHHSGPPRKKRSGPGPKKRRGDRGTD